VASGDGLGVGCNGGLCCFAPDWRLPYWIAFPEAFVILIGVVAADLRNFAAFNSRHSETIFQKLLHFQYTTYSSNRLDPCSEAWNNTKAKLIFKINDLNIIGRNDPRRTYYTMRIDDD